MNKDKMMADERTTPNTLKRLWAAWKRVGQAIGDFIGRLVLTVFYFTLLMPFGVGMRLLGDPLKIRPGQSAGWENRTAYEDDLAQARRLA